MYTSRIGLSKEIKKYTKVGRSQPHFHLFYKHMDSAVAIKLYTHHTQK